MAALMFERRVTIRPSTVKERESVGRHIYAGQLMPAKRWIVVDADQPTKWLGAFGLPYTENAKADILWWAQRWVSKNGGELVLPSEFKGVRPREPRGD